jgi:hypothetical protein
MLNDIPEGYFLKRFDSKVIVVGVRFDELLWWELGLMIAEFFQFYLLSSYLKIVKGYCGDGYTFKFGDPLDQYIC